MPMTKLIDSIVERLRKGSTDYDAFIKEMVDAGMDEHSARILLNRFIEQVALEKSQGDA